VAEKPSISDYYTRGVPSHVRREVGGLSAEALLATDLEQLIAYWIEECTGDPLLVQVDAMSVTPAPDNSTITIDAGPIPRTAQRVRLHIPVDPHPQPEWYFGHDPSGCLLSREPDWGFDGDSLTMVIEPDPATLEDIKKRIVRWIDGRNREIAAGNATLGRTVREIVSSIHAARNESRSALNTAIVKLGLPLRKDPHASARPIPLERRQLRRIPERPSPIGRSPPHLESADVAAFVDFLDDYGRQFETAPTVYSKLDEESLRDLLLGMANTNYPGHGTAETFSKLGKTDITWRTDEGHVLIIECKFWTGSQGYAAALDQLFRYLTWRQNYAILLTFCTRKDMTASMASAKDAMQGHTSFLARALPPIGPSRWTSAHRHPQDPLQQIEVHHMFYDLSI
jgi:hypothetical protein